ncbi:hypothetical protein [Janthinobacterium agaricidamnosum]|uniref:GspL cytoplasmic actin-ATPase-like domain-containing protein n=1 Tax=Janthinobacterium agaricidamnosum NBRC 102515 = DSM 9628 TaxID=1349767 RepID=W0V0B9_9BURK|nr:hypothetical protein [Janthinobacterium agaricidamnosum]CDG81316.1 hypothetical protein GJA_657 [Janthinobacterium agaricidamnosum NBRC 102515 = DSM 9628]
MSLIKQFFRPVLSLHLAPQQLSGVLYRGGKLVSGSAFATAIDNPGGHWQVSLAALTRHLQHLAQLQPGGARPPLSVSLSSRWCRMALVPWSDALLSDSAAARFLQTQLAALYGDEARGWAIVADDAPYGQPRLVCGIDSELRQALQAAAAEHGHILRAVEPVVSVAGRAIAAKQPQAFAVIEAGRLVIAAVASGRITALQSQPCPAAWHTELQQAWRRWTLRTPALAQIQDVLVIDVSGAAPASTVLPSGFRHAAAPLAHLIRESAWA